MVRYPIMTAGANVVNPGLPIKYCLLFAVLVAAAGLGSLFLSEKHKKEQLLEDVMVLDTLLKKSLEKSFVHKLKFAAKNAELEQEQLHLEKLYRELKEMEAKNKELTLMLEDALLIKKRRGKSSNDEVAREGRADETEVDETETKFRVIEPEKPSKTKEKPGPSLFDFFNAIAEGAFRKAHSQEDFHEDDQVDVYFEMLGDDNGNVFVVSQEENSNLQPDIVRLDHLFSSPPEENQANVVLSESKEKGNTNGIAELNRIEEALEIVDAVKMGVNHHPLVMEVEFQDDIKLEQIPNSVMEEFERDAKSESISPPGTLDEPKGNFIEIEYNPLILQNEFGKDSEIVSKSNELGSSDSFRSSSIEKEKEGDSKTKANTEETISESGKQPNKKPVRSKSKSSITETKQKSLQKPDEKDTFDIITGPEVAENGKNTETESVISDGKDNKLESKASNINIDEIHKDTKTKAKSVSERKQPRNIEPNLKTDISNLNKNMRKESKSVSKRKESGSKQKLESNAEYDDIDKSNKNIKSVSKRKDSGSKQELESNAEYDDIDKSNKNIKPESKSVSKRKGPKKEASLKGEDETDITKLNKRAEAGNQPELNLKAEEDSDNVENNTNSKKKSVSKRNKSISKKKVETNEDVISGESETATKTESMKTQKKRDDRNQREEK